MCVYRTGTTAPPRRYVPWIFCIIHSFCAFFSFARPSPGRTRARRRRAARRHSFAIAVMLAGHAPCADRVLAVCLPCADHMLTMCPPCADLVLIVCGHVLVVCRPCAETSSSSQPCWQSRSELPSSSTSTRTAFSFAPYQMVSYPSVPSRSVSDGLVSFRTFSLRIRWSRTLLYLLAPYQMVSYPSVPSRSMPHGCGTKL